MRKITQQASSAFEQGKNFTLSNTQVKIEGNNKYMYLWGNLIARQLENKPLEINLCGYNTVTTRERLNGLWGVNLKSKQGTVYLNNEPISSDKWYSIGLRLGV